MRLPRRLALSALALLTTVSLVACGGTTSSGSSGSGSDGAVSGTVAVFAAASLQDPFEAIATEFEAAHPGTDVSFDFQGSQDLVSSLQEGASADVLATASNTTMDDAASASLVGTPSELATNFLVLIVPAGNPKGVTGLNDGSLNSADLVICAPEVPCGEATQKVATELGVTLNPVSEEQKVTDVRGKVESGEADAGIVYATDATAAGDKVETITLPDSSVINHYPIAVTQSATNSTGAQAFMDFVLSDTGQKILQKTYGFGAPAAK